jgi:hypothetical protein
MNTFDIHHLCTHYRDAFAALPEPYQNDNCLDFYVDVNGGLCCTPKIGQEFALGEWEAVYDEDADDWFDISWDDPNPLPCPFFRFQL